ncbi:MAG: hypothetical protein ACRESZ_04875 [Methylococcales bacterium]
MSEFRIEPEKTGANKGVQIHDKGIMGATGLPRMPNPNPKAGITL